MPKTPTQIRRRITALRRRWRRGGESLIKELKEIFGGSVVGALSMEGEKLGRWQAIIGFQSLLQAP
jgi:hypothetical protein